MHQGIQDLIYLAAFQLDKGESVGHTLTEVDIPGTRLGDALRFSETGEDVSLDADLAIQLMYAAPHRPSPLLRSLAFVPCTAPFSAVYQRHSPGVTGHRRSSSARRTKRSTPICSEQWPYDRLASASCKLDTAQPPFTPAPSPD